MLPEITYVTVKLRRAVLRVFTEVGNDNGRKVLHAGTHACELLGDRRMRVLQVVEPGPELAVAAIQAPGTVIESLARLIPLVPPLAASPDQLVSVGYHASRLKSEILH